MPEQFWNKYPTNISHAIAYLGKEAASPQFDTVVVGKKIQGVNQATLNTVTGVNLLMQNLVDREVSVP